MVAVYVPHIRLQFGGIIGSPALEVWSNTVNFVLQTDSAPPFDADETESIEASSSTLDEALVGLVAPLGNWFSGADASISGGCDLTYAKLNWIKSDGKQRDAVTHQLDFTPARSGSAGGTDAPHWYETICLTHRTAKKRGRGHSGRIFPPVVKVRPETPFTPYISVTKAGAMAAAWTIALNGIADAINDASDLPTSRVRPVVVSVGNTASITTRKGTVIPPRPGALTFVTGVVCDRVGDVQHRRTKQVPRVEGAYAAFIDN